MSKISVIIPVYNVENYLRECIDSVLHQTFQNMEIIIIDDGSTDNSGKICDEYKKKDSRMIVIHQENGGLGNARNVGMDIASGKYIVFLDSDDYWDLDTLETLYNEAEKNQTEILVFSAEPFWNCDRKPDFPITNYSHSAQNGIVKSGCESINTAFERNEYFASSCLRFMLTDYVVQGGFRFNEGIIHEDESFSFLSYINAQRVECLGQQFYKRRYRDGSIMTALNIQRSTYGYSVVFATVLEDYETREKTLSHLGRELYIRQMKRYLWIVIGNYRKTVKEAPDIARQIKSEVQPIIKKGNIIKRKLPFGYRLAVRNLCVAYLYYGFKLKFLEICEKKK